MNLIKYIKLSTLKVRTFVEVVISEIFLLIFHRKTPGKLSGLRYYNTLYSGIVYVVKCWSRDEGLWFECRQDLILYFPITPTTNAVPTHLRNKYVLGPFPCRERKTAVMYQLYLVDSS